MITLIKYELLKLFKRVKTLVVVIAFMLLTAVLTFGLYKDSENMKRYNSPEFQIENMERNISFNEKQKENLPPDVRNDDSKKEDYIKSLDADTARLKNELSKLKALNGKEVDWKEDLNTSIKNLETALNETQGDFKESNGDIDQQLQQLKYLRDNNIKPIEPYEFNGFSYLEKLISILGQVFLIIGIAIFTADMVSGECTPPTLKLLLTQPVSRGKVIFSKFISVTLAAIGLILSIEIVSFLVVGLIYGFGNSAYPVMVGAKYQFNQAVFLENGGHPLNIIAGSSHIIPMWKYIMELLLTQGLYILACTSFVFLVSALFKSSMVSMGVATVSLIAMTIVFNLVGFLKKFAMYVFTSYIDMGAVIKGQTALMFNDPSSTFGLAIIVFLVWTVVCYLIAHVVFTKKDILI